MTIYIDDQPYQVDAEDNLLANVLSQKLNLPYFCWHPSMGSVGACRQCAVTQYANEEDTRGRIVMSCMTPVTEGMRIGLNDHDSADFREQVISAMMTNHPHDCPVCAEGGECHLQDMTVMTGHSMRSYQGEKRTFTNQYLGELVGHEMNRCITCYRCVRFYKDYAGGEDFGVFGSKNQVYFGRQQDGPLESEFSGNLVEVCPTGVFTNKVFSSHYTRKWDLQSAPSVCGHCAVGCTTSIGERYGSVRRVMNRYNADLNGYFLCDRGRFGIGFVNGNERINHVKGIRQQSPTGLTQLDVNKAFAHLRGKKLIGIGSARASLEVNAYLKTIVGNHAFSTGLNENQTHLATTHLSIVKQFSSATISDIEQSDCVLIIGEDITQTSPRISLAVRQALRNKSIEKAQKIGIPKWQDDAVRTCGGNDLTPLYSFNQIATKLDKVSKAVIRQPVEMVVKCLTALVHCIENNGDLEGGFLSSEEGLSSELLALLTSLYKDLNNAKRPLIVSGWSTGSHELLQVIEQFMTVLTQKANNQTSSIAVPQCVLLPPEANSIGLMSLLDKQSLSIEQVIEQLEQKAFDGVLITENTLDSCNKRQKEQLLHSADVTIVIDHSQHILSQHADIVMPAAAVSESNGCYVNYLGRVQPFHQSHLPKLPIVESWRWLTHFDGLINDHANFNQGRAYEQRTQSIKSLSELRDYLDTCYAQFNFDAYEQESGLLARETKRASGRTAKTANQSVHEPKSAVVDDGVFSFSMEGHKATSTADMPFVWSPSWNSNQAITQFQERVGGALVNKRDVCTVDFSQCCLATSDLVEERNAENVVTNQHTIVLGENLETITLVTTTNWYLGEWQASLNPEFQMLHKYNTCLVSAQLATKQNWSSGQLLKFSSDSDTVFARIEIERRRENISGNASHVIEDNLISLNCIELALNEIHVQQFTHMTMASEEELNAFVGSNQERLTLAKSAKQAVLSRLQDNDQFIPIRLHAGGLNDG